MIHMYTYNITQNKIKELSTQYYTIMRRIYVGTFPSEFGNSKKNWHNILQPVPWKMRLEKLKEMQIEILNGGEILVNCRFKCNKNLNLNLYRKIPRNSNPIKISIRLCTVRYWEIWLSWFWLVDQNLLTIQDMDLHFFHRFESHLPGNGLYLPSAYHRPWFSWCDGTQLFDANFEEKITGKMAFPGNIAAHLYMQNSRKQLNRHPTLHTYTHMYTSLIALRRVWLGVKKICCNSRFVMGEVTCIQSHTHMHTYSHTLSLSFSLPPPLSHTHKVLVRY